MPPQPVPDFLTGLLLMGASTLAFGTVTGATMAAGSTCTVSVDVTATKAGQFENVSGYISSTESGENKTPDGFASDSLIAIAPPEITKAFAVTTLLRNAYTDLSFSITNPNQTEDLSGIAFTDTLPAALTVADSSDSAMRRNINFRCGNRCNQFYRRLFGS